MATITSVDIGAAPDDGNGDPLRTAFNKLNTNDTNLNAELGGAIQGPAQTADIENDAVTFPKMQNIATQTLMGRTTAATGDPEELTATQARAVLNVEDGAAADQVATDVPFTPNGTIAATNVQAAVQEVRDEGSLISSEDELAGQMQIAAVTTLPGTPDANTIYFVLTSIVAVWLTAGQSNMINGVAIEAQDQITTPGIFMLGSPSESGEIIIPAKEALENFNDYRPGAIGPAYVFAKSYKLDNPTEQVVLVPDGRGGSGFDNGAWIPGGAQYDNAIRRANLVMNSQPNTVFMGVIWHQGEQDADIGMTEATYATFLDDLISNMRTDIVGASNSVFLVGEMAQQWVADNPGLRTPVQDAIIDTPNRNTNCALATSVGCAVFDGLHFDDTSQRDLMGPRYYSAYLSI